MSSIYVCDCCEYRNKVDEFGDVKDVDMRFSPGSVYTDKECPECGSLAYPESKIATAEDFQSKAQIILAELRSLAEENLKDNGLTSEDCQLVGIRIALQELDAKITGVEDVDIVGNPESWLQAILANEDKEIPSAFVDKLEAAGWHTAYENESLSALETTAVVDDNTTINVHFVIDWEDKGVNLNFGHNSGEGFEDGMSVYFDFDEPEFLQTEMIESIRGEWEEILEQCDHYSDEFDSLIEDRIEELAKLLIQTPS